MTPVLDDPYLNSPLHGVRLIEASAGTGKTFTLATLFTRLVVERGLRLGQVLAVTYTDAATQELRRRIRERLALALTLVGQEPPAEASVEVALTCALLQRHLAGGTEGPAQLARRLRIAAEETDLAAIFTIHGFCARVLREHALASGHGFDAPALLTQPRALREELAADLWRCHASDPGQVEALTALWSSPEALANDLDALLGQPPLWPLPPATPLADPEPALTRAQAQLQQAIAQHLSAARAVIAEAYAQKWLHGNRARRSSLEAAFAELERGADNGDWSRDKARHLDKLLPSRLREACHDQHRDRAPTGPLFDALADWCAADDAIQHWRGQQCIALLHRLRAQARQRWAALKRERRLHSYDDLIDGVADALDGRQADELVTQLRAQYRIALVDEFQDTDARQWRIFARVFGAAGPAPSDPALFLIGDPKQAIYGFRGGDVHTYLRAKAEADPAPPLNRNFRSRPALLRALQTLYDAAGEAAFDEPGIRFEPVLAGTRRRDEDYLLDGASVPALTVRLLPGDGDGDKALAADAARAAVTAACVADIHQALSQARAGRRLIDGRPLRPADIAVLVRSHREATRIQRALAAAGIAAVAAGKQSLYASTEAHELRLLLLALLQPSDSGRLRAALATVLLGENAAALAALEADGERQRDWQDRLLHWRERCQRGGPFALVADLAAAQAERLLELVDGERRLTNYLQLGEGLQEAAARALGLHGLLDWLQRRIADADADDETQLLRLESDAQRVQIVTLHKSKGLEYPLVYLPFVGFGSRRPDQDRRYTVQDGEQRRLYWRIDKDDPDWQRVRTTARRERAAEDARLLYVGLTRAEHGLWIAAGALPDFAQSPLAPLLSTLPALAANPDLRIVAAPADAPPPRLSPECAAAPPPPRPPGRTPAPDWWVYSFTQLAHAEAGHDPAAAASELAGAAADEPPVPAAAETDDEPVSAAVAFDPRFAGSRFGNVLHKALEDSDFTAWSGWRGGDPAPSGQRALLAEALLGDDGGYAQHDLDDGVALLTELVGQTLTVTLPEGGALHRLAPSQRRAEIEFHFALQPTAVPALLALLHQYGVAGQRHGFGRRPRLEGLMTGKIDLTYQREGRWYLLDYKSNRLPRYDGAYLAAAMADSEYDLQALIYTLALHRWLRFRLGADYDYERDFGGVRYLFCRGLDATATPSPGLYAQRFAPALVQALDVLFAGGEAAHARLLARIGVPA